MEQQVIDYRDPLAAHQLRCAVVALEEPMNVLRRWGSVERDIYNVPLRVLAALIDTSVCLADDSARSRPRCRDHLSDLETWTAQTTRRFEQIASELTPAGDTERVRWALRSVQLGLRFGLEMLDGNAVRLDELLDCAAGAAQVPDIESFRRRWRDRLRRAGIDEP